MKEKRRRVEEREREREREQRCENEHDEETRRDGTRWCGSNEGPGSARSDSSAARYSVLGKSKRQGNE